MQIVDTMDNTIHSDVQVALGGGGWWSHVKILTDVVLYIFMHEAPRLPSPRCSK